MARERGAAESAEIQRRYFETADIERFHWTTRAAGFAEAGGCLAGPLRRAGDRALPGDRVRRGQQSPCACRGKCVALGLICISPRLRLRPARCRRFVSVSPTPSHFPFATAVSAWCSFAISCITSTAGPCPPRSCPRSCPGRASLPLEPNGRNPLINLQTRLVRAETGARSSTPDHIAGLLSDLPLTDLRISMLEPLPLRRAVLHYQFGLPSLGRYAAASRLLSDLEWLIGRVLPRSRWSYIAATAARREARPG